MEGVLVFRCILYFITHYYLFNMVPIDIENQMPSRVLSYMLVTTGFVYVPLLVFGMLILFLGTLGGTCTVNGVSSPCDIPASIPGLVLIVVALFIPLWSALWYWLFKFNVGERGINIHSGVIIRSSETIDYNQVQSVDNVRGPILMLFGLAAVNIWTSSPAQISFNSKGGGSTKPDGKIYLFRQDAEDLKVYIMSKVHGVPVAASQLPAQPSAPQPLA